MVVESRWSAGVKGSQLQEGSARALKTKRNLDAVEGAERALAAAGDRAVELVDVGALVCGGHKRRECADGTGEHHVVTGLVQGQGTIEEGPGDVIGEGDICPRAVERMERIGRFADSLGGAAGGRIAGSFGRGGGHGAEGAQFAAIQPDHYVDLLHGAGGEGAGGRLAKDPAIEVGGAGLVLELLGLHLGGELHHHMRREGAEIFESGLGLARSRFAYGYAEGLSIGERTRISQAHGRTAFQDGAAEQAGRKRRGDQHAGVDGAGGFAEEGDVGRVAAELRDIAAHPLQGRELIEEAVVAGAVVRRLAGELGMREESHHSETVVDSDQDDAVRSQRGSVVGGLRAAAGGVAAAVEPHHHGKTSFGGPGCEGTAKLLEPGEEQKKAFKCIKERLKAGDEILEEAKRPTVINSTKLQLIPSMFSVSLMKQTMLKNTS